MRRVTIEWSYPMDIDNILLDERMQDIGIYITLQVSLEIM